MMKNTRAQNQIHGLTRQTEVALIKRARTGDVDARNSLMEAYYATAKASCRRHAHKKGVNQEDADSEIFFAIAEAINGYDLRRNVPFAAYLDQRARGAITWTHRESKKQDLRKLTEDFHKRFGGSGPPGKGREPQRRAKEPPVRMSTIREGLIANYINFQRGSYFVQWLKECPRRNDRRIARWLWSRVVPKSQAEIARALDISRSAVCQRRKMLILEILGVPENTLTDEVLRSAPLNKIRVDCYLSMDFD